MNNKLPTDKELRDEHGENIEIRHQMPSREEISENRSLIWKIASGVGYEKWMWKSCTGAVLGVIIVAPNVSSIIDFWKPITISGYHYATPYISMISQGAVEIGSDLVMFSDNLYGGKFAHRKFDKHIAIGPAPQNNIEKFLTPSANFFSGTIWRLSRYTDLTGRGGLAASGRWHTRPAPVVYTSGSVLGALEELIYIVGDPILFPDDLNLIKIYVEGTLEDLSGNTELRKNIQNIDYTREVGNKWRTENRAAILAVPSAIGDFTNYVINVDHKDLEMRVVQVNHFNPAQIRI